MQYNDISVFLARVLTADCKSASFPVPDALRNIWNNWDMVSTRKTITATHTGELFGMPPTNKNVSINVIDIIRLEHGKYAEHWGQSNFADVIAALAKG